MSDQWEIIVNDRSQSVRRLAVPTGWVYQTQDGRKYNSIAGTIGRDSDPGYPTWGPMVFVPKEPEGAPGQRLKFGALEYGDCFICWPVPGSYLGAQRLLVKIGELTANNGGGVESTMNAEMGVIKVLP